MKFSEIQQSIKAPKSEFNGFGKYAYRTCSAILEAVKPLLGDATLIISDELVMIGERYYIKATAVYDNKENGEHYESTAYAREPQSEKGKAESQVTGTASTYARKTALGGLFAIDDSSEDPDATNTHGQNKPQKPKARTNTPKKAKTPDLDPSQPATDTQVREFVEAASKFANIKHRNFDEVMKAANTTKTMRNLGTDENTADYNQVQCAAATELVRSWIRKSIESGA